MPWHIEEQHESCPASEPWAVVKDDDGEVEGCHPSKGEAEAQLAALYASETESKGRDPEPDEVRMVPTGAARLRTEDGDGNGRTLVGYAAVFDSWTEIDSYEGRFMESLDPKAFNRTLKARAGKIKVLFDHGMDPNIGNKPLGRPSVIKPDEFGLWTETPLAATSYNEDLRELVAVGAIDGMSFRMRVKHDEWLDHPAGSAANPNRLPERRIREVELFEFGPVTFPAYEATTAGVRGRDAYVAWREWRQHHNQNQTINVLNVADRADDTLTVSTLLVAATAEHSTSTVATGSPDRVPPAVAAAMRRLEMVADISRRIERAEQARRR